MKKPGKKGKSDSKKPYYEESKNEQEEESKSVEKGLSRKQKRLQKMKNKTQVISSDDDQVVEMEPHEVEGSSNDDSEEEMTSSTRKAMNKFAIDSESEEEKVKKSSRKKSNKKKSKDNTTSLEENLEETLVENLEENLEESSDKDISLTESKKKSKVVKEKRLTNKERKKMKEEKDRLERELEYARVANPLEGSQFSVSQPVITADSNWDYLTDIKITNFSINAHNKLLFDNASLTITAGGKYGLVGPNGQGKTTLLKMIALGELKIPPLIDCLYVEQEVVADSTRAVDAVLKADKERWSLMEEEKKLLEELKVAPDDKKDERLNEVYDLMMSMNASAAEAKARRILFGLGFDSEMQEKETINFSGGWRMRISIAKALFMEPTLLMLDEPTNHLDLNAVIWLDDYLQKWKKTLLIVSHDADFLNSVCSDILHMDQKKINHYKGNYYQFRTMEKQKRKQLQKQWEQQEKRLRQLKSSGSSSKKATDIVKKKREAGARSEKKKNKTSVECTQGNEETKELIKRPREYTVKFFFPEVNQFPPPIIEVKEVSFGYPNGQCLFKNVDFGLDLDSRVCIVGPNGVGKSTLLKLITGDLNVVEGEVRRNPRIRTGVYNQHFVDKLPMGETPVEYIRRLFPDQTYEGTRKLLGSVGLEAHGHEIKCRDLSGGQKARVVLAELILLNPHLLILDEPTNNLDIESIDALCDALNHFNGGVVIVTHDARLIEACNCLLWVCEDQGVFEWEGGFDEYRQSILDDLVVKAEAAERKVEERREKKQLLKMNRSQHQQQQQQ